MNINKKNFVLTIAFVMVVLTTSLIMFFNKPVKLEIGKDTIKISGVYGVNLKMEDIEEVTLKDTLPEHINKGSMKKSRSISVGNFKQSNQEGIKVVTYSMKGPYIYITTRDEDTKYVIINYKDKKQTEELYKIILNNIKDN